MESFILKNHADVSGEELVKEVEKSVKRKRVESDFLKCRNRAKNTFKNQIDNSVGTKRASIVRAVSKVGKSDYTVDRFIAELEQSAKILKDSGNFKEACKDNGVKHHDVATHIAFEGESKVWLVLKNGLIETYYDRLKEFKDPLYSEQELKCATKPDCKDCPPDGELLKNESSTEQENSSTK